MRLYAELEKKAKNNKEAEKIYQKYYKTTPYIGFWKSYLDFVKEKQSSEEGKSEISKAYKFALEDNKMGLDFESGALWKEYIELLKELNVKKKKKKFLQIFFFFFFLNLFFILPIKIFRSIFKK